MIKKATFKDCALLQDSRYAPFAGYTVFIINDTYLIFEDEIIEDFDVDYHKDIFEIEQTVD